MFLKSLFKDICKDMDNMIRVSENFAEFTTDDDRFSFVYHLCEVYFSRLNLTYTSKNNENSDTFRKKGNEFYMNHSYWSALELYNKSIAFATRDSSELCFAYGNRASCLLRLNYPEEALNDVETALNICSQCAFKEKLLIRKEHCISALKNKNASHGASFGCGKLPNFSREKSSYFDSASNVVQFSQDDYWNRKLAVNEDIKVGEVLMIEKPYASIVLPQHFYTHCSKCFMRCLNLIPCDNCTTTMFCSKECKASALHSIECLYLGIVCGLNAEKRELLSLKILIDASNEGKELEKLYETVSASKHDENIQFYNSLDFINIYNLVTNSEKRSTSDLFYRSVISAILIFIIGKYTRFFNYIREERKPMLKIFCGGLILRLMQSLPCNAHEISEYYNGNLQEIGAGAYSTLSLINHSCDPNVVRYSCKDTIVLKAIKPINKGEQIFDNYGYHYATHNLEERQVALEKQYYFKCQCKACIGGWPLFGELIERPLKLINSSDSVLYKKLTEKFEEDLQKVLNGEYNDSILERNIAYLCYLHDVVELPWINYNKCQELIKHCLNFQYNHFKLLDEMLK